MAIKHYDHAGVFMPLQLAGTGGHSVLTLTAVEALAAVIAMLAAFVEAAYRFAKQGKLINLRRGFFCDWSDLVL